MREIIDYFVNEKHTTSVVANVLTKTLIKYDDIKEGFVYYLKHRKYPEYPEISGYNPKQISDIQPELDAAGVFQFLVTLRDNPLKAEEYIKNNFARK